MRSRSRWVVALVVGVLFAAPAMAHATLAFVRQPLVKSTVWVAADDGSAQRRLAAGSNPHVSPDGETIAYLRTRARGRYRPELMIVPANGGTQPRRLLANWSQPYVFDWSPDSSTIATVRGPDLGRKSLVLIDVASGAQRVVARGYFNGVSFAPEGGQLVFARSNSERFPPRSDLYRLDLLPPGVESVTSGTLALLPEEPVQLTHDHRSLSPLWGPKQIVFVKSIGAKQRRYGPKNELFLISPDGKEVRRLTHTRVGALLVGLSPTGWSRDGSRLLAEFGGQDTSYAVRVNPRTGVQRPVGKTGERGLVGAAISSDGRFVLGFTGGFEPGPGHDAVRTPYEGGRPKVLARNAFEPDWSN